MKIRYSQSKEPYNVYSESAAYFPRSLTAYKLSTAPKSCTRFNIISDTSRRTLLVCADGHSKKLFHTGNCDGYSSLSFDRTDGQDFEIMKALFEHGFISNDNFVNFCRQGLREFYRNNVSYKVASQIEALKTLGIVADPEVLFANLAAKTELPARYAAAENLVTQWDA